MFRKLELPEGIKGQLFLSRMPGRRESLSIALEALQDKQISKIVSLTGMVEICEKSPTYATAIQEGGLPCERVEYPIDDFGCPLDVSEFVTQVRSVERMLRDGEKVLLHCAGGHGRTGMFANCLLQTLGVCPATEAFRQVDAAGSGYDTEEQRQLILSFSEQLSQRQNL